MCVCGWGRVQQEVRDRKSGGLQLVCWSRSWAGPQQFVNMCMYVRVCVRACVHQGLVQVIVYRGEGAGAAASPCHDGETLGRLADSLGQRRLLGQVVSLCRGQRARRSEGLVDNKRQRKKEGKTAGRPRLGSVCCSESETAPPGV